MARKTPEGRFNEDLDDKLKSRWPECEIVKLDPMVNYQGIPDKLVMFPGSKFAVLETKASFKAKRQNNQEYHVEQLANIGFSAFINPDNCDEVLDAIQETLGV